MPASYLEFSGVSIGIYLKWQLALILSGVSTGINFEWQLAINFKCHLELIMQVF